MSTEVGLKVDRLPFSSYCRLLKPSDMTALVLLVIIHYLDLKDCTKMSKNIIIKVVYNK